MITWHEVVGSEEIEGEYVAPSFSSTDTGGPQADNFAETREGKGFPYIAGDNGWFAEDYSYYESLTQDENGEKGPFCGEFVGEAEEFPPFSLVIITRIFASYKDGGYTQSLVGNGYTWSGGDGVAVEEMGVITCEPFESFDSDWSRSSATLRTYELTTLQVFGRTTAEIQTQTTTTTDVGTGTSLTIIPTTSMGTVATQVGKPTWKTVNYETVLTRGQTWRKRYSSFGNSAPATTAETFGEVTTFVSVEETFDNLSFVEQTVIDTDTFEPYKITNTITTIATDQVQFASTTSTSGSTLARFASGPQVVPQTFPFFAGTTNSTYFPETIEGVESGPQFSERPFIEKQGTLLNNINKIVSLGTGNMLVNYPITQTITSFDLENIYATLIDPVFPYTSPSVTYRKETPVGGAGVVQAMLQTQLLNGQISQEFACKLQGGAGGGGGYTKPTPFGLNFRDETFEAVIPATGRTTVGQSTYTYYGSQWTRTFPAGTTTTTESGVVGTTGDSTSFYRPTAYPAPEGHSRYGGRISGVSVVPAGLNVVYSGGDSVTQMFSEPVAISWGNNAEITAYKKLEWYVRATISGVPNIYNTFATPVNNTQLWPLGDVLDD